MSSLDDYISELAVQQQKTNALASTLEDYRHEPPLEHDGLEAPEAHATTGSLGKGQRTKAFAGEGSVRDFRAGTSFALTQHPVHDHDHSR